MSSDILKALIAGIGLAALWCPVQGDQPKAIPLYNIQHNTDNNWTETISINGMPILHQGLGGGLEPLDGMVINGDNRLDIDITQTHPTAEPYEFVLFSGALNDPYRNRIKSFEVTSNGISTTFHKTIHFNAEIPVRFPWQDGEHLDSLSPTDQAAIFAKFQELVSAMKAGDAERVANLHEILLRTASIITGQDAATLNTDYAKSFSDSFAKKTGPIEVRDRNEMKLVPYGQIVLLSLKSRPSNFEDDWVLRFPISKGKPDPHVKLNIVVNEVRLSKIQGQWQLIN